MSNYVRETKAAKSISAKLIFKGSRLVATVQISYSAGGVCLVNIWQEAEAAKRSAAARAKAGKPFKAEEYRNPGAFQWGRAGGYGYDKATAALARMIVDGHELTDHCGGRLALPKGAKVFPSDFKAPKGYSLANYCSVSAATGRAVHRYEWTDKAKAELGFDVATMNPTDASPWEKITAHAFDLQKAWEDSADCIRGYSDCYRLSGLEYLRDKGYTIHDAI